MENKKNLTDRANEARKNYDWNLANELYKKIISEPEHQNIWDEYFYALSCYKIKRYNESLILCRNMHKANKNFDPNKKLYARNIIHYVMNSSSEIDEKKVIKALDAVKKLVGTNDKYLKYDFWFNKILKLFVKEKQYLKAQAMIEWTSATVFSDKAGEIIIDGKKREIASTLEDFLVESAKVYFNINNFDKALETIDNIFENIKTLHYSNHIWLKRLKAQIFVKKGEQEKALELYFTILKTKTDWFIYFELAKILFLMQNNEAGIYFLAKAAKENQNIKFKIKLMEFILHNEITEFEQKNTANLLCAIYKENNWRLNDRVNYLIKKAEVEYQNINKKINYQRKFMTTANKLSQGETDKGSIIKTFNNYTGLLKNTTSTYFYVTKNLTVNKNDLVIFRTTWSYDFKKKTVNKSAIVIDKITNTKD